MQRPSKRRELKGVALSIAQKMVTRYVDVDGYWAMGKLYRLASWHRVNECRIDLISQTMRPKARWSKVVIKQLGDHLRKKLKNLGFTMDYVKAVEIVIEFNTPPSKNHPILTRARGEPYICTVFLTSDLDKTWRESVYGYCGKHDPRLELRSVR